MRKKIKETIIWQHCHSHSANPIHVKFSDTAICVHRVWVGLMHFSMGCHLPLFVPASKRVAREEGIISETKSTYPAHLGGYCCSQPKRAHLSTIQSAIFFSVVVYSSLRKLTKKPSVTSIARCTFLASVSNLELS